MKTSSRARGFRINTWAKTGFLIALCWQFSAPCEAAKPKKGEPQSGADALQAGTQASKNGDFESAAAFLGAASAHFHAKGQEAAETGALLQLGQAQIALGQWDVALETLQKALDLSRATGKTDDVTAAQSALGSLYVQTNAPILAESALNEALAGAQKQKDRAAIARITNSQGTLLVLEERSEEAAQSFLQSAQIARELGDNSLLARVCINQATVATRTGQIAPATAFLESAETALKNGSGAEKVELLASVGAGYEALSQRRESDETAKTRQLSAARDNYEKARVGAETLGNAHLQSLSLGSIGQLAEKTGDVESALRLTRQARFFAQQSGAAYLLYRWEWQMGRLLRAQGRNADAISAYQRSVATFRTLCNCGGAPAFAGYEATVRPLYYQLADLLLQRSQTPGAGEDGVREVQLLLTQARDTVELLKTAELSDYFRDNCVANGLAKTKDLGAVLNQAGDKAAVLYFVPLPDRTEILVELPSGLQRFTAPVAAPTLMARARRLRLQLQRPASNGYLTYSQEIYNWLIRPIVPTLEKNGVETLVFVLDSALRTIPMAALNDGDSFLAEHYKIAVAPALTLIDPRPLQPGGTRVFAGGLSESVQGFDALTSVSQEISSIQKSYATTTLLNQNFLSSKMETAISSGNFSIVHLASHGEFGSQSANTYLLTYDGKVTLDELERAIRPRQYRGTPVELLVLSACQTAAGDDRAALGLAGIAVKAGARSALASLWSVSDEATSELIARFYAELKAHPGASKAAALQAAQLQLMHDERFSHPSFWAPYLLIGNWM